MFGDYWKIFDVCLFSAKFYLCQRSLDLPGPGNFRYKIDIHDTDVLYYPGNRQKGVEQIA